MAFRSKGKILAISDPKKGGIGTIVAEMHEGFFGKSHIIKIEIDRKFLVEFLMNLGLTAWIPRGRERSEEEKKASAEAEKNIIGRPIEIIIK